MSADAIRRHSTIEPPHLTREQRIRMRDEIALRVLPYCLMQKGTVGSVGERATRSAEEAYVIADAVLAARSMVS